jgi:hypothetical protein
MVLPIVTKFLLSKVRLSIEVDEQDTLALFGELLTKIPRSGRLSNTTLVVRDRKDVGARWRSSNCKHEGVTGRKPVRLGG